MKKKQLGQFFTTSKKVHKIMKSFISHKNKNITKCLEPSAGSGELLKLFENLKYKNVDAVELDKTIKNVSKTKITYCDFFEYSAKKYGYYDLIIGNPPYVKIKDIDANDKIFSKFEQIKQKYNQKANLYYLFIDRCIDLLANGGELIFIVPKEWLYTSSAKPLRNKMLSVGKITHLCDCGEEKLFKDADLPSCIIFRFVKAEKQNGIIHFDGCDNAIRNSFNKWTLRIYGDYLFLGPVCIYKKIKKWHKLSEYFDAKVGIVSGADKLFEICNASEFEAETIKEYITTAGVKKYIDVNDYDSIEKVPIRTRKYLKKHKIELLNRQIHEFGDSNWWKYGAIRNKTLMLSGKQRFYCYAKTRNNPFFINNEAKLYNGGILGIFEKSNQPYKLSDLVKILNSDEYKKILKYLLLTTSNKLSLQVPTLNNLPIPTSKSEIF